MAAKRGRPSGRAGSCEGAALEVQPEVVETRRKGSMDEPAQGQSSTESRILSCGYWSFSVPPIFIGAIANTRWERLPGDMLSVPG